MAEWIGRLPLTSLGASSRQIFTALTELNQLITTPATRLALLELLRAPVEQLSRLLERHFSNQPLQLHDTALEAARLAQAMQARLWCGYRQVLLDTDRGGLPAQGGSVKAPAVAATAIARAIAAQGEILLRSSQLYVPTPAGFWHALHQLYLLAEQLDCTTVEVPDPLLQQSGGMSPAAAYLRALLFNIAQPQQLRQQSCLPLYRALELWSREACLLPLQQTPVHHPFRVDLQSDLPPIYVDHDRQAMPGMWRLLNLKPILDRLEQLAATSTDQPCPIDRDLVDQLLVSWGTRVTRRFQRIESHDEVEIIIGLPSIHFHGADRIDFSEWLAPLTTVRSPKTAEPSRKTTMPRADIWDSAFDAQADFDPLLHLPKSSAYLEIAQPTAPQRTPMAQLSEHYPIHLVEVANSSISGYCLRWSRPITERIQSGTLLGIRTHPATPWHIAVTRWVRLDESAEARIGVELLSPQAKPCAVRLESRNSESTEFMRGLMLPEVPVTGQPASLILFCKPFRTRDKVTLIHGDYSGTVRLMRMVRKNSTFAQFEFLVLQSAPPMQNSTTPSQPGFDRLWQML